VDLCRSEKKGRLPEETALNFFSLALLLFEIGSLQPNKSALQRSFGPHYID
jgi:hypothetical protein